jgi:hypothetical protein
MTVTERVWFLRQARDALFELRRIPRQVDVSCDSRAAGSSTMSRLEQDLSALAFRRRADEAVAAFDVMSSEKYSLSVS